MEMLCLTENKAIPFKLENKIIVLNRGNTRTQVLYNKLKKNATGE